MKRLAVLLCFLLFCGAAGAVQVPGLYAAEVPVRDQSAEARTAGVANALRQVLVKLTGDRGAGSGAAVAGLLDRAGDYVQQYRYREVEMPPLEAGGNPWRELRLWVQFDEAALDRDLRGLGVPIWDRERPATLAWLVMGGEQGRDWITPDLHPALVGALNRRAEARGIVVVHPLFDLEDASALTVSDVWGGFPQAVQNASLRYRADAVLTGVLEPVAAGIWEARWTVYLDGGAHSFTSAGDLPEAVLEEGVDGLADLLAARYVQTTVSGEAIPAEVTVADVFTVDDYARVLKYLSSLNSVASIEVARVEPGQVSFALRVHGGEPALAQAVALGRTLESVAPGQGGLYRLLP
jgi:hypothetical protein